MSSARAVSVRQSQHDGRRGGILVAVAIWLALATATRETRETVQRWRGRVTQESGACDAKVEWRVTQKGWDTFHMAKGYSVWGSSA